MCFFFFKQKTAYEMRISDWSSDVCSSDLPAATQTMLDDARFDVAAWLAAEISTEFGEAESEAFIAGNGKNKPRGFLSYDTVANASYAWGTVGFVKTGAAAAFASTDPGDALIDLLF